MLLIGEYMKKRYLLLFLMIVLTVSLNVRAVTLDACTTEKMNNLKEIANKMEFNYTYENKNGVLDFTIHATGLNKEIKALIIQDFYSMNYKEFKNDGKGNSKLSGFKEGENVTITLKAYTPDQCSTRTVTVKQVKLPYHNEYYDEEFCKTNPNFKYCNEFTESKITKEQYDREMKKYLEETKEQNQTEDKKDNLWLIIGIGVGVVAIVGGVVTYILIRRKKNEL